MGERSKSRQLQAICSPQGAVGRLHVSGLHYQQSLYGMRRLCLALKAEEPLDCGRHDVDEEQLRQHALLALWQRLRCKRQ